MANIRIRFGKSGEAWNIEKSMEQLAYHSPSRPFSYEWKRMIMRLTGVLLLHNESNTQIAIEIRISVCVALSEMQLKLTVQEDRWSHYNAFALAQHEMMRRSAVCRSILRRSNAATIPTTLTSDVTYSALVAFAGHGYCTSIVCTVFSLTNLQISLAYETAESLSLVASLIAVVQINGTVVTYCYGYREGFKSASKDISRLTPEVIS